MTSEQDLYPENIKNDVVNTFQHEEKIKNLENDTLPHVEAKERFAKIGNSVKEYLKNKIEKIRRKGDSLDLKALTLDIKTFAHKFERLKISSNL